MRLLGGGQGREHRAPHRAQVDEDGSLLLALEPGNERLPWLEGEDEDEDEEPELNRGRLLAVVLGLLLFLLLLVGIAWWLWARSSAPELAADGSTIEAPEGPYKVRPRSPGGREVMGTGGRSFEVAEGLQVEGRIADGPPPAPSPAAEGSGESAAAGVQASGIGVQIGAYPTRESAQAGWTQMSSRMEPLRGRAHRILEGTADSGTIFRLQVVTESEVAARQLCATLRQAGGDCQVKQ